MQCQVFHFNYYALKILARGFHDLKKNKNKNKTLRIIFFVSSHDVYWIDWSEQSALDRLKYWFQHNVLWNCVITYLQQKQAHWWWYWMCAARCCSRHPIITLPLSFQEHKNESWINDLQPLLLLCVYTDPSFSINCAATLRIRIIAQKSQNGLSLYPSDIMLCFSLDNI